VTFGELLFYNLFMTKALIVIPARYNSKRFPGKPLSLIKGEPMIKWVYKGSEESKLAERVIVATDSQKIYDTVIKFGGEAQMTSKNCRNGTERVAEVAKNLRYPIIVNVQGDEPLIRGELIDMLINDLIFNKEIDITTAVRKASLSELSDPNKAKVVFDKRGIALYFSRNLIPYPYGEGSSPQYYRHIGIYAYRREALLKIASSPPTPLEEIEDLEQLRALELGMRIRCIFSPFQLVSVDLPEDIKKVEEILESDETQRNKGNPF